MKLRPYQAADRIRCLAIFDSNTYRHLLASQRLLFESYLRQPHGPFFVVEDEAQSVVACGGYVIQPDGTSAYLNWGMVVRDYQWRGIGRFLLLARLNLLCEAPDVTLVTSEATQHTYSFFEKYGFDLQGITEGGLGPGLHRYDMALALDDARRASIQAEWQSIVLAEGSPAEGTPAEE